MPAIDAINAVPDGRYRVAACRTRSRRPCALIDCSRQLDCPANSYPAPPSQSGMEELWERLQPRYADVKRNRGLSRSHNSSHPLPHGGDCIRRNRQEAPGAPFQYIPAVGNSGLAHKDVLSVS